jgi:hypothetical protein
MYYFQKEAKGVHFAYQKQPKEAWEMARDTIFNHNMPLSHESLNSKQQPSWLVWESRESKRD